ncbi:MAG TPA: hypothetical protein VJ810_14965 [Blastocatellia bacterium]|nr:hypothetical protein [Blastocatellia bacterium]
MFSNTDYRRIIRRSVFTAAPLTALIAIGIAINAVSANRASRGFEQARDFPRGAVVYAQFKDLPEAIKQWDESALKGRYLASVNYQKMWSRHLANKLFSRWEEFNSAAGFSLGASAFSAIADNRAAVAVYDIGRFDLVVIAPLSDAKFAVTQFFQHKDSFEQIELPGGTVYYLSEVEADNGRQKQQIGFAQLKDRFVVATSEKLLLRAIANISGQAKKDRMTDEPSFQSLSKTVTPHFMTVWVNQKHLNDDWYFKRYWLMRNAEELKNIRAGIFDLELRNNRWVERREFILDGRSSSAGAAVSKQSLQEIERIIPAGAAFARIRGIGGDQNAAVEMVHEALFDGKVEGSVESRDWNWERYEDSDFDVAAEDEEFYGYSRYSSLSHKYDLDVDDPDAAGERGSGEVDDATIRLKGEEKLAALLRSALRPSRPSVAARIAEPLAIGGPLFAEFRRAAIIVMEDPASLERESLERAIAGLAAGRLMIAGAPATFGWDSRNANGVEWREMRLPMLGRAVGYGVRGRHLIVSNNPETLASLMTGAQSIREIQSYTPVHELTIIRLSQRKKAFDQIFARLDESRIKAYWKERRGAEVNQLGPNEPSMEFFSGEISSLLDVAAPVEQIRIQRSYAAGRLREEVSMVLN